MFTTCETGLPVGVHDEGVATVVSTELHHQSELVDGASSLKQWHQLVLVHVPGQLSYEDLAAPWGGCPLPACSAITGVRSVHTSVSQTRGCWFFTATLTWGRATILPLTILLHHVVASPLHQSQQRHFSRARQRKVVRRKHIDLGQDPAHFSFKVQIPVPVCPTNISENRSAAAATSVPRSIRPVCIH